MKRSELLNKIQEYLDHNEYHGYSNSADAILEMCEEDGMTPPTYINPRAYKDGLFNGEVNSGIALARYIDKYPAYYFEGRRQRPYEFYCEGWEDET